MDLELFFFRIQILLKVWDLNGYGSTTLQNIIELLISLSIGYEAGRMCKFLLLGKRYHFDTVHMYSIENLACT